MDRCRDYFRFAAWFAGIGYAVLWPLSASGDGGYPFGASVLCRDAGDGVIAALCDLPHPFTLPIGLHVLGFAAVMMVTARASIGVLCRWRQRPGVMPATTLNGRLPGAIPARPQSPARRLRTVKPRKHFGLRGVPR
jgi:hypothetical protein